jgi:tol-pal system protein YbgF
MKPYSLLLLFALGGFSMPSCALPPVVNTTGGYPAPAPEKANAPKPPASSNTMYEILNRLEQLQSEVQTLTGKVEEQAYQNAELKKRLSTMYSDFDERMQNVENKLEGEKSADAENPAEPESPPADRSAPENAAAPEEAPAAESKPAESEDQAADKAQPPAAPKQAQAQAVPEHENQEYRQAYDALRNGRTTQSIEAFNAFLNNYPSSQLAGNAQYWLGEAYRVNQDADSARKAFNKVIDNYPDSAKVPDALLKLGYVEFDLNNMVKAREYLTQVTTNFPDTTAARLASKKLLLIKDAKP